MKSKDVKVNALKHDLDCLQAKLAEALSAVRQGSDQLSVKELEASSSRIQLEKVLASIQEKDKESNNLQLALTTVEYELEKLLAQKFGPGKELFLSPRTSSERSDALNERQASLQRMIQQLEDRHQSEVEALKNELNKTCNEGGKSNEEKGQQISLLKDTVEHLQVQLNAETEKLNAALATYSSLQIELQAKDEQINCLAIQISQQKELLAGLSQQIRDKDASIVQVMESAANERVTLGEEKLSLVAQLENVEQTHTRLKEICQQLEDRISHSQNEIDSINNEKLELLKEKDGLTGELAKVSKEKDAMKKKLQAALVIRKDLQKKLEEYENHKEDSVTYKSQIALLQDQLQEMRNDAQALAKIYQEKVSLLEHTILEKEGEIGGLKTDREELVAQLQSEKQLLQTTLHQKEVNLSENLQTISEKTSLIEQLQTSAAEKEKASDQERNGLIQKIEELCNEIRVCQDELKNSSSSAVNLETELAQMKSEKAILQKKAQAALLARKETIKKAQDSEKKLTQELAELKDDYKALLEQRCQQTNELNALQLNFDERVRELEALQKMSLCHLDELGTLKQLVLERDKTVQDLKMSLAEKERQCHSIPHLQTELETVKSQAEKMSLKIASKDEALVVMEQKTEALKLELDTVRYDLEKAFARVQEQMEEIEKYKLTVKANEVESQQGKHILFQENPVLETRVNVSGSTLEDQLHANEEKCHHLMEENTVVLEQHNQMKVELQTALALVSQKSMDVLTSEKKCVETQQQLSDDKAVLTKKLDEAKISYDLLKQETESALKVVGELREEVTVLNMQLREAETLTELQEKMSENLEVKLKERDDALLVFEAKFAEKEELIAALELQLKQQSKLHETAIEKMRVEVDDLQKSQGDTNKLNDQDRQNKVTLLTRKLQAALVSRKDLLKENETLKEEVQKLSSRHQTKEEECLDLESSVLKLKQQNIQLESSVAFLNKEKHELSTEVDHIRNDNRSLAAACDSLKLTIENITQQKQAFSCQLESLKDSQTEDLSRWKSKHADLKQDYESLLQAYENVSSEMDKMRQLLEGAKRDRQEALRRAHKQETEIDVMENKARELEEENERIKEKMRKFSKQKQQKIEELEEENREMRLELTEDKENDKTAMLELKDRNKQLDAEICEVKESSEALKVKLELMMAQNSQLERNLEEVSSSSEKKHTESNAYTSNMQLKLDEALGLNNSLTAQIEAQKTELAAQLEINNLLQKDKQTLSERIEMIQSDHELQMGKTDDVIKELRDTISQHSQETISINEKVRILEDDKSLLQEELENVQEISDKVKNENEYLETVILKNSERIDELTESVHDLKTQNTQLSSQLAASKERSDQIRQEKEEEQLKLVREFEEKLKMVQRGNQGSKNVKKELQELLREKHQEINHLQQNCIKYQELILDLESSLKNLQSAHEHLEIELQKGSEKIMVLEERNKQVEAELTAQNNLLQEATEKVVTVESERDQLALEMQRKQSEDQIMEKTKSLQNIDQRQINSFVENQTVLEEQINKLNDLKDKECQKVNELRQHIDSQDLQISTLKREAETNEAKLYALSSTSQGAEAAKLWNNLYQNILNEKDNQLLEQGFVIKRFLEDMRVKDKEVNELRVTKSRLERTLNEYSVAAAAQQRQLFVMSARNAELLESMELMTVQVKELSAQVEQIEQEKRELTWQLTDKQDMISQMQLNLQQVEKINSDTDTQLLFLQTQNGKCQADLEKQEGISLQLKTLLRSKDAEISSLLSCKDGQMSGYLEQVQANYRLQVAVYEERLTSLCNQREKTDKELRGVEAKLKSLQIKVNRSDQEKEQLVEKMESFKNSVVSLQSERDRLMSEHRILKAKSELGLKGKESSSEGEGGASKGLKHEIRKLLHQMDDLNSENAMLRAQLVRYREDLNQVLSLKDNQLKVLLKKQQDVIKDLENHKTVAEKQHRESHLELQKGEEVNELLKVDISKLRSQVSKLEAEISDQKKYKATTDVGKVISDLQEAVAAKAAECNDLHRKVLSQKNVIDEVNDKMQQVENETDKKLAEAEDKYNAELDTFEREVDLMRTEQETAAQRVAELAKDLLEMEQQLTEAKNQNKDIKAQNESLCKSMAALQNDRDQLIEDFKILRYRYDEELQESRAALNKVERNLQDATSDLAMFAKERDILVHKLTAFESKNTHAELNKLLDELSKALLEKEKKLKQVSLENNTYSRQLSAFSRSMASLQNDRDRLMDELAGTRQGSSPESKGSGISTLQTETDGLKLDEKMVYKKLPEEITRSREVETLRCDTERKDTLLVKESLADTMVSQLESEKVRLHGDLQRCMYEIQQRDHYLQQLNTKLQQAVEEKGACAAQMRAVVQTLRDTQNRCHWLETQVQGQAQQGSVYAEVAPGAPQERSRESMVVETAEVGQLRDRLLEVEQILADERARRETAEEALRLAEDRVKSVSGASRVDEPDFSIDMETEEGWGALSLDPNQPLITRQVKGGMVACRRWLRGRSLYFSKLLTSRTRSRYLFLAYLLTIHVLVLMCLTGAL
nr:golgin subfamily B member 1 isoform X7 [Solea senegalensis]